MKTSFKTNATKAHTRLITHLPRILDTQPLETWRILEISQGLAPECASSMIFCRVESGSGRPFTYTPPSWFTPLCPEIQSRVTRQSYSYILCASCFIRSYHNNPKHRGMILKEVRKREKGGYGEADLTHENINGTLYHGSKDPNQSIWKASSIERAIPVTSRPRQKLLIKAILLLSLSSYRLRRET